MSGQTRIGWTDATWNFISGCTEVSPGCDHCYAKTFAERWRGVPGHPFENGFDVTLRPEKLGLPLSWRKPKLVFVNSMADLFHRDVPDALIAHAWWIMGQCAGYLDPSRYRPHTFQILTKRPERMKRWVRDWSENDKKRASWIQSFGEIDDWMGGPLYWPRPLGNIWLGVSIESNAYAWRADMLRETPAAIRFLSLEPLLGPVDQVNLDGIDWVIVGGESGAGARPMDLDWARGVRDRCVARDIPYFFKQIGGRNKRDGADALLDGRTWTEFPLRTAVPA